MDCAVQSAAWVHGRRSGGGDGGSAHRKQRHKNPTEKSEEQNMRFIPPPPPSVADTGRLKNSRWDIKADDNMYYVIFLYNS